MASEWETLVDDLEAESAVVRAAIEHVDDSAWDRPSPAEGWTLRDCVVHLAETDDSATAGVLGEELVRNGRREGVLTPGMLRGRSLTPDEVREWYRSSNARLIAALRALKGDERLTWAGRAMSARSFTTARLMEHWSHGLDILETAGVPAVDTDRLRHIALLGHLTRDFAYRTHGLEPPTTALYVELTAPSGATWRFGPPDAPDRIFGSAGDFCRVVTQRIHPDDTSLRSEGPHAREFLSIAQAFAGPPGAGRPPRSEPRA
ncbi:MAG TPA: TIGR03084 family metal-binding protein [Dehalococcoidia bacterium]|nr:TIGR03084 family metal-binding protein [Dehalococcoidia bacterium]